MTFSIWRAFFAAAFQIGLHTAQMQLVPLTCMLMRRSIFSVGSVASTAAIRTPPNNVFRLFFFVLRNFLLNAASNKYSAAANRNRGRHFVAY